MKNKLKYKVVIDTNIYISAIFWGGKPRQVVNLGRMGEIIIFTSNTIEQEIAEKLIDKFNLSKTETEQILIDFSTFTNNIQVNTKLNIIESDPDDNKFLECGVDAKSEFIVSGDKHLLNLKKYKTIKIVNPSDFLAAIKI
jgi:uncharacterized protein